jgi:hypothetical protein
MSGSARGIASFGNEAKQQWRARVHHQQTQGALILGSS